MEKERLAEVLLEIADRNAYDLENEEELLEAGKLLTEEFSEVGQLCLKKLKELRDIA